MEWSVVEKRNLSYSYIEVSAAWVGNDVLLCVRGGDKPHIGCTVQAIPRPSLTGDGSASVTSSVMNITGHKDEALCRRLAEQICRETGGAVTCTGGFHVDGMGREQIEEVVAAMDGITAAVRAGLGLVLQRTL